MTNLPREHYGRALQGYAKLRLVGEIIGRKPHGTCPWSGLVEEFLKRLAVEPRLPPTSYFSIPPFALPRVRSAGESGGAHFGELPLAGVRQARLQREASPGSGGRLGRRL